MLVGVYAFLVMAAFIPATPDAATMPRWAIIALAPAITLWLPPSRLTVPHLAGFVALSWAFVSLFWSANSYDGAGEFIKLCLLGAVFGIGMRAPSLKPVYIGAALGLWVSAFVVLLERYGQIYVEPHVMQYAGLFINPNLLAEVSALVILGLVIERCWWPIIGLVPCIIIPDSRGPLLALAGIGIIALWRKSKLLMLIAGITVACLLAWWSFKTGKYISTVQRFGLLQDNLRCLNIWGYGLGSYDTVFPYCSNTSINLFFQRAEQAHNDYLQWLIELGPGAVFLFGFVAMCLWRSVNPQRYVIYCFLMEAAVGFPSYMPATAFIAALVLGYLCRDWPSLWPMLRPRRTLFHPGLHGRRTLGFPVLRFAERFGVSL